jgi:hypothetical protein
MPARENLLQRAFSTFPSGWPGIGLLVLRVAIGGAMIAEGAACLATSERATTWAWTVGLLAVISGGSLLVGFLTPIASALAALTSVAISARPPATLPSTFHATLLIVLVGMVAAAIGLLGPGALSIDARRFGRREIHIPRGQASED